MGISPGDSTGDYLAFTIDGAIGAFEDGELTEAVYLSDEPGLTIRNATGRGSLDDKIRVAVYLSNPASAGSDEVFLVDLVTYEVIFSVAGECPCAGIVPTPDGEGLVLDTGDTVTVHTADGNARALTATSIDRSAGTVVHAVDSSRDLILRGLPDGTVEQIDLGSGRSRTISEFGGEVSAVAYVDATRAAVVTRSGQVWLINTETAERIGLVWEGGAGDTTSGAPTVSEDGDFLWVPTSSEIVEVPLSPDTWRELACDLAGRELTAEEWDSLVPGDDPPRPLCPERT